MPSLLPPWPISAVVYTQDPDNYGLNVMLTGFFGGQGPVLPVRVLTQGQRDPLRSKRPALPLPGTHGLVVFPRGDNRSGHWIGATDPALIDSSHMAPGLGNVEYEAFYDGGWYWHGADGTRAVVCPDGSTLLWGAGSMPNPTRHTLDGGGARTRTPFTAGQRVAAAPGPFPFAYQRPDGSSATLDASGNWTVTAAGGATMLLSSGGAIMLTAAQGQPVIVPGNLAVSGEVWRGYGTADQVSVGQHRHGTGTAAAGTVAPTPGT